MDRSVVQRVVFPSCGAEDAEDAEIPQVQFLEFLDKEKVVGMIV